MRKISLWLFIFAFAVFASGGARAQDAATQQQLDQINGRIQDLVDAQAAQGKRIEALEKSISDLSVKLNQPGGNNFASADDLKKLADEVQEVDRKRQSDNDAILKELEKLDKAMGVASPERKTTANTSTTETNGAAGAPQKGYEYQIASGDNLSAIAKAYRAQGVKVTVDQILAANPGLNPKNLIVGKKIFIPDANAK